MLCKFASGARGTFEVSRTMVGPESENAFDVYGTRGAVGWNFERLNELRLYRATEDRGSGYTTVLGGERFGHHGIFVPGSGNTIGFEDLVTIEDYEFCAAVAEGRPFEPSFEQALAWAAVQDALLRSAQSGGWEQVESRDRDDRGRAAADRGDRRRADRADARRADRPPGPRRGARRRVRRVRARGARRRGRRSGCPRPRASRRSSTADLDAVAICSSSDTHVDLLIAAAQAGKAVFCEKPVSLDLAEVDRALGGDRRRRRAVPDRLQPPVRPGARLGSRGGRVGRGGRSAPGADLEPRPRAAAARVRQDLRRTVPRHDDPRLRHGQVRDRQRGGRGVRARRAADRAVVRARPATSTPRWSRSCTRTVA